MSETPKPPPTPSDDAPQPGGREALPHPALDPTKKTDATHDPTADDPGNGGD